MKYILLHDKDEDTLKINGYTPTECLEALLIAIRSLSKDEYEKIKLIQHKILDECIGDLLINE